MPTGDYEVRIVPNTNELLKRGNSLTMKETTAYRGEYLVFDCPYCGEKHYLDIEDDIGDGNLPESGRKMTCEKCKEIMLVLPW